jgi:hypothetical protein
VGIKKCILFGVHLAKITEVIDIHNYAKIYGNRDFVNALGIFLVEVVNDQIEVIQLTVGGESVDNYFGYNPCI